MQRKIETQTGDVEAFEVQSIEARRSLVRVFDHDSEETPLITARLLPSEAIKLARALLDSVDVGVKTGNHTTYTFID